jgi:2-(1,2-epoxy-1,2-dihydrophenyl)acetyl-CoA isomerase
MHRGKMDEAGKLGTLARNGAPPRNATGKIMSSRVEFEITNGVATVRLNDPATLNALTTEVTDALHEAARRAQREARAMLLCGAGRGFCSGWNLGTTNPGGEEPFDAGRALEFHVNPLMRTLRDLEIPWIAAVHRAAAGVGASIALCADLIVAGENAYFLQAFRRIGLVPDGGATWLLAQSAGRARAMELMLLGEKLPAPKALEWGLINRVVADDDVLTTAATLANELASGPTRALSLIRKAAWNATASPLDTALDTERHMQTEAGQTEDFREGVLAFFEKRPARFAGR